MNENLKGLGDKVRTLDEAKADIGTQAKHKSLTCPHCGKESVALIDILETETAYDLGLAHQTIDSQTARIKELGAANKTQRKALKEIKDFAETQDKEPRDLPWKMVANTARDALKAVEAK